MLKELINVLLKMWMLVYVVPHGGGNLRTWGKPPVLNQQPLLYQMLIPGIEPRLLQ